MNLPFNFIDRTAFSNATDAFLAVSGIYFDCTAQLSWKAIVFNQETVQTCLTTCRDISMAKDPSAPLTAPLTLTRSLMAHALENTRDGCNAIMQAHVRSARILKDRMNATAGIFPPTSEMSDAAEMFTRMFSQMSAHANQPPVASAQATAA